MLAFNPRPVINKRQPPVGAGSFGCLPQVTVALYANSTEITGSTILAHSPRYNMVNFGSRFATYLADVLVALQDDSLVIPVLSVPGVRPDAMAIECSPAACVVHSVFPFSLLYHRPCKWVVMLSWWQI